MIELTIPMPPSVNEMYINRPHGQRGRGRVLSTKAREFKKEVALMTKSEVNASDLYFDPSDEYGLFIIMYTPRANRDVSNIIKPTEDAIFEALGISDSHDMTVIVHKEKCKESYCVVYFGLERDVINQAFMVL